MSNSRDKIFAKLKKFKNDAPLKIKTFESNYDDIIKEFIDNATLAGAQVYSSSSEIEKFQTKNLNSPFKYNGSLGVAENGTIWCYEDLAKNRADLFTCVELIITLKKENLVSNMHEAYKTIDLEKRDFGTFIAGPSKTADIEQSLVIGAHGAMGLHIILID